MYDVYDAHAYTHEYGHDVCTLNTVFSFFFFYFLLYRVGRPLGKARIRIAKKKKM